MIGEASAKALADGLRTNTTLQTLKYIPQSCLVPSHLSSLSFNQIGDGGAEALADGLRTNITLQSLRYTAELSRPISPTQPA